MSSRPRLSSASKKLLRSAVASCDLLESRRLFASIATTAPYNGQQLASTSGDLTVRFNEAMNAATLNASTVRLFDAAGNEVAAAYAYSTSTNTLTVDPVQNLQSTNSYYLLRVVGGASGVKDAGGGTLAADWEVSFTTGAPSFNESTAISGLVDPTAVEFADDGRIFVAEKRGVIKVFDSFSDSTPDIFADLRTRVHNYWDRGLLGMTLDPQFTTGRPYVYVLYTFDGDVGGTAPKWGTANTNSDPGSSDGSSTVSGRLSKLVASGNVMTGVEQVLIHDWQNQYPSHSIGDLSFGTDGFLYASAGDGASFGTVDTGQINAFNDPANEGGALRSQDIRSGGDPVGLDGTIIRVDPDTGLGASGNPFASSSDANAKRIISYGLRNPYRFTFRPGTSEIWIAETGWNDYEEINRITNASDASAENFGWPAYEGPSPQPGYASANLPLLQSLYAQGPSAVNMPWFSYTHAQQIVPGSVEPTGGSSPTGIVFYTGGAYPAAYEGAMLFTDYSRKQIYVMYKGANGLPDPATRQIFRSLPNSAVDLVQGPDGAIYYTDFYNGRITRIAYNGSGAAPTSGKLSGVSLSTPGTTGHAASSAFDGDFFTYFASTTPNDGWVGLDLGAPRWVRQIKFAPRNGNSVGMVGGRFQGSNDADFAAGVVDLFTIANAPTAGTLTSVDVNPTGANFRYVRYIGPDGSSANVAELEFHAGG
ncbi:MAG: PQQ-dependent sugar dehydrogenase, partial [Burkholderiales bacterium]|nr:PQQ-dependent sugar dehydrogenase [Phycisphaerae bacterium]